MLSDMPTLVGEVVPRGVDDGQVGAAIGIGEEGPQPFSGLRIGGGPGMGRAGIGHLAGRALIGAVSYTHLDVYKRQYHERTPGT